MMKKITIRFGGYQNPDSIHNQAALFFGQKLKEQFGDLVDFELIGNVMVHGRMSGDLPDMVATQELTCCYISTVRFAELIPEIAVIDLPFIIKDRQTIQNAFRNQFGDHLKKRFQIVTPFNLMGIWDNGFRHITNQIRPIHHPQDCVGLNIRTQISQIHVDSLQCMGCHPIPVDVKEFVAQIATDRFNAQDNPLTNTYNFGVHKYHHYITLSSHFFGGAAFICNRAIYDTWTPEFQMAFDAIGQLATEYQWGLAAKEDDLILQKLATEPNAINVLTSQERQEFIVAVAPVLDRYRQLIPTEIFDMLEHQ